MKNSGVSISTAAASYKNMMRKTLAEVIPFDMPKSKPKIRCRPWFTQRSYFNYFQTHEVEALPGFVEDALTNFDLETLIEKIITPTLISVEKLGLRGTEDLAR